jgi:hypothetical protein
LVGEWRAGDVRGTVSRLRAGRRSGWQADLALLGDRAWWPGERRAIAPDWLVQEENRRECDSRAVFG